MNRKIVKTQLPKKHFDERLKSMTVPYKFGDNVAYREKECYTLKQKENTFRIERHTPYVWNHDGYWCEFLYGKYEIDDNQNVVVKYHFSKPVWVIIPFLAMIIMCLPIFLALVYELVVNKHFDIAIIISGIFSVVGTIGLLGISKKSRKSYIEILSKICKTDISL